MPFAPSKRKPKRRGEGPVNLSLTSLMDIFTIILIFLLMSYSSEGEIMTSDPRLKLPVSTSSQSPKLKLSVQLTTDEIIVDGIKVTTVQEAMSGEDYLIKPVLAALEKNTERMKFIAKSNVALKFTGDIVIMGDVHIPFSLIERVMYTCGQAGYGNISLAVASSDK